MALFDFHPWTEEILVLATLPVHIVVVVVTHVIMSICSTSQIMSRTQQQNSESFPPLIRPQDTTT
jgi:hypothetical protein